MSEAQQGPESLWRHSVQSAIAIVSTFVKFRLIVKNHWDNGNIDQDSNTDNSSCMTKSFKTEFTQKTEAVFAHNEQWWT